MRFSISFFLLCVVGASSSSVAVAKPLKILNLNVFDQLQGEWGADFREKRIKKLSNWVFKNSPDILVFQEAKGELSGDQGGGTDSLDGKFVKKKYAYRKYIHEMTGKDGASYGYWIGAKKKPVKEWSDGFSFLGGLARKTQAALWTGLGAKKKDCLGILSLHLSYQTTEVRQEEAKWILSWLKNAEKECAHWMVLGDFNADAESKEMQLLFQGGLKSLVKEAKPTVGAFNPIRQIYGKDIPSKTIDWALGWNIKNTNAEIVFDQPVDGEWLSDHAGILIQ